MDIEEENRVTRLKDTEIFKIKLSLSSLTNTVVLCPVISSLYTQSISDKETWTFLKRGVPGMILIHNGGSEIASVQICLADPDTGFALWREELFLRSDYKASQRNFHTFKIFSSDDGLMAGIKFSQEEAANTFLRDVLSSLPKDKPVGSVNSPKIEKRRLSSKKIRKDEISSPCMFTHVTSMNNAMRKDPSRTLSSRRKQSGSGSSLDAPDANSNHSANGSSLSGFVGSRSTPC